MPPREAAHRIRDIIDAIEKVERYAQADPDLKSEVQLEAVLYNLAVIGEAVQAIPQDVRTSSRMPTGNQRRSCEISWFIATSPPTHS